MTDPAVQTSDSELRALVERALGAHYELDCEIGRGGMGIVYRAKDIAEARQIADADPMHRDGVRSYKIIPWLMNEGSFTLTVKIAAQKIEYA